MANQAQYYALPPAVAVDGNFDPSERPYLEDLNINDIGAVMQIDYIDPNDGVEKAGFQVTAWYGKEMRYVDYIFDPVDFANVAALQTYLQSTVPADNASQVLEKYENWSAFNLYKEISPASDILLNNSKVKKREYVPSTGKTNLYVDLGHTFQYDIFTVDGDQTIAKGYYYTGSF